MSHALTPPFLVKLGLDASADVRAIRRAYAQLLKRIDQAADPEGFQTLRAAYETALMWIERQASAHEPHEPVQVEAPNEEQEQAPTPRTRIEAPEELNPRMLGDQVFELFAAYDFTDTEPRVSNWIEAALANPKLVNIEARTWFEWRVASRLLDGWQPGHEVLFVAACKCFNWEEDRRRLSLFGQAGAALDAAIQQKLIFTSQASAQKARERRLIMGLRSEQMPSESALRSDVPELNVLMQRYPHWLRIITPHARYLERCAALKALSPRARSTNGDEAPPADSGGPVRPWGMFLLLLGLAVVVLAVASIQKQTERESRIQFAQPRPSAQASGPLQLAPISSPTGSWTSGQSVNGSNFLKSNEPERNAYGLPPVTNFDPPKKRDKFLPIPAALPAIPTSKPITEEAKEAKTPFVQQANEAPPSPSAKPVETPHEAAPPAPSRFGHRWQESLTNKPRTSPPTGDWRDNVAPPPPPPVNDWKRPALSLSPGEQASSSPGRNP